jgi:tetratricopeptide (TPR) repeat protein
VYLEAVRLRSSYWWCYYKLAIFYHDTGRDSLAVEWLKRASEVAPGNPDVYSALSAIYFYAGLGEEAMRMSERSIDAEPSWEGYNNLGTLHFTESEYADAIRNYKKALACDGPGYEVWGNLAAAYEWTSDDRDSVDLFYRRAAELCEPVYTSRPNDPHVVINLASYYAEIGTPEDALELVRRATEIAPEDAYVALHAGHTYEVLGERDMALRWIERALAFGYSREEIEDTPALRELCTDARYRSLVQRGSNNEGT